MESYAGTTGDLDEDGQQAFETRGLRDLHFVDECRDEVVGVFEGVADVVQTLDEEPGAFVDVVRGAIEFAVDCIVFGHLSYKLIIHRSRAFFVNIVYTEERACEGGSLAEGNEECFVDLALRVDEDAAEEQYESADREHKGGDEL